MGRNYEEWVEATGERGLQLDLRRICPGVEGLPQDGEPPSQDTDSRGRGRWVPCCRAVVLLVTLEQRISSGWELAGNADAGALPQTHPIRDCTLGAGFHRPSRWFWGAEKSENRWACGDWNGQAGWKGRGDL